MSHDDIIPYTNTSKDPFIHELFGQFLVPSEGKEGITIIIHLLMALHLDYFVRYTLCST